MERAGDHSHGKRASLLTTILCSSGGDCNELKEGEANAAERFEAAAPAAAAVGARRRRTAAPAWECRRGEPLRAATAHGRHAPGLPLSFVRWTHAKDPRPAQHWRSAVFAYSQGDCQGRFQLSFNEGLAMSMVGEQHYIRDLKSVCRQWGEGTARGAAGTTWVHTHRKSNRGAEGRRPRRQAMPYGGQPRRRPLPGAA